MCSGVPQGSILVPLLFVVYVNELFRVVESHSSCKLLLYADDAKVFSTNPVKLQSAIHKLNICVQSRQLSLAPSKCEHFALSCSHGVMTMPMNFTLIIRKFHSSDGRVVRASTAGAVALGLIPSLVKPNDFIIDVHSFLPDAQH